MKEKRQLTKAQIVQELDRVPDEILMKVLKYLRSLDTASEDKLYQSSQLSEENAEIEDRAWQAYLDSERERKEVYHRLANS